MPNGRAAVDIFRLENGKIVEHWDYFNRYLPGWPTTIRCSDCFGRQKTRPRMVLAGHPPAGNFICRRQGKAEARLYAC